jgi:hypothetical protein
MKNISELDAVNARLVEITHLLSLEDILLFSSNPDITTVQTLQTERAKLLHRRAQLIFKEECRRIEASLPRFDELSDAEIEAWLNTQPVLHWCPVLADDRGVVILHERHNYYLAHCFTHHDESWVAVAWGTKITPKLVKKLSSRFPIWEN